MLLSFGRVGWGCNGVGGAGERGGIGKRFTCKFSFRETSEWGLGPGDPEGDPRGILLGIRLKTGDPGLGQLIKTGGSGERTNPFYNIKRVHWKCFQVASFWASFWVGALPCFLEFYRALTFAQKDEV